MISRTGDPMKFIKAVQDKEHAEIIRMAEEEAMAAERITHGPKPKVKDRPMEAITWENRKWAMQEYGKFLGAFLFFMRNPVIKPSMTEDWQFHLFRPVCENLVQKKQFPPEVMDFFKQE